MANDISEMLVNIINSIININDYCWSCLVRSDQRGHGEQRGQNGRILQRKLVLRVVRDVRQRERAHRRRGEDARVPGNN